MDQNLKFRRKDVLELTGLKAALFTTWKDRGYLDPLSGEPVKGWRAYSLFEVIRFAVLAKLIKEIGVGPGSAHSLAQALEYTLSRDPQRLQNPLFAVFFPSTGACHIVDTHEVRIPPDSDAVIVLPLRDFIADITARACELKKKSSSTAKREKAEA